MSSAGQLEAQFHFPASPMTLHRFFTSEEYRFDSPVSNFHSVQGYDKIKSGSENDFEFAIPSINYPDPYKVIEDTETLHVDRGIYLMESFWRNRGLPTLKIGLAENNAYNLDGLPELHHATVKLHHLVNPEHAHRLTKRELLFGMGATQCFHAAVYAIYKKIGRPIIVTAQLPGYLEYKNLVEIHHEGYATWMSIDDVIDLPDTSNVIEIVCSPNNPDGRILNKVTDAAYTIHDRVNHWPFLMHETDFSQEDYSNESISIYSYPKIFGFSGSRVGYVFVEDASLVESMRKYMVFACHGLCTEGQLKCLQAVRYVLEQPQVFLNEMMSLCKSRWASFEQAINNSSLEATLLNSQGPTAWLKFRTNSKSVLNPLNIVATYGSEYGVSDQYARINLLMMPNVFDAMIRRF